MKIFLVRHRYGGLDWSDAFRTMQTGDEHAAAEEFAARTCAGDPERISSFSQGVDVEVRSIEGEALSEKITTLRVHVELNPSYHSKILGIDADADRFQRHPIFQDMRVIPESEFTLAIEELKRIWADANEGKLLKLPAIPPSGMRGDQEVTNTHHHHNEKAAEDTSEQKERALGGGSTTTAESTNPPADQVGKQSFGDPSDPNMSQANTAPEEVPVSEASEKAASDTAND